MVFDFCPPLATDVSVLEESLTRSFPVLSGVLAAAGSSTAAFAAVEASGRGQCLSFRKDLATPRSEAAVSTCHRVLSKACVTKSIAAGKVTSGQPEETLAG